eukprot:GFUD01140436.1.p1 GENE.GFUD01140436.1~~GFUD01140436.1.p1  ORF type:complete len:435 (+),score=117.77 GFUD01140436.1:49-1353(+)
MASNKDYDRNADFDLKRLEELAKDSAVGDTMYEKRSVIEKVLEVGKHFQKTCYVRDGKILELDPKIEDLMCTLWDISVEEDVSVFYFEHGVLDIFVELFSNPNVRVKEISIGVMANMVFHKRVFLSIIEKDKYLEKCLKLLEEKDSPTLVIVFRCLHSYGFNLFNLFISDETSPSKEEIKNLLSRCLVFLSIESIVQSIGIIIASCTNKEVLSNASKFLSIVGELWEESEERRKVSQFYAEEQFLVCVLEAMSESVGIDKTEKHFAVFLNIVYENDVDKEIFGALSEKVINVVDKLLKDHVLEYNAIEDTDLEFIFNLAYLVKVSIESGGFEKLPNKLISHLKTVQHRVETSEINPSNENRTSILNLLKSSVSNIQSMQQNGGGEDSDHESGSTSHDSSANNSPVTFRTPANYSPVTFGTPANDSPFTFGTPNH